jgi:hypothetical protein
MEIRKWTTVDVHYNEDEQNLAAKERKRLEFLGYEFQQSGAGSEYHYTDQYIKSAKIRTVINIIEPIKPKQTNEMRLNFLFKFFISKEDVLRIALRRGIKIKLKDKIITIKDNGCIVEPIK